MPIDPHAHILLPVAAELGLLCLAMYLLCRRSGYAVSEAAASAPIVTFLFVTILFQQHRMLSCWPITITLETAAGTAAAWHIWRCRSLLAADGIAAARLLAAHPVVSAGTIPVVLYLGCQSLLLSSMEMGTEPLRSGCDAGNIAPLAFMLQRFDLPTGFGLFSFLAYASIGFATYALARRHAWPDTAFIAALIVLSSPRLVLLSTAPAQEGSIVFAAMFLFLLLSCYRLIEIPSVHDLGAFAGATLFCLSGGPLQMSLTAILLLLAATLLNRRHGRTHWLHLLSRNRRTVLLYLAPLSLMLFFPMNIPTLHSTASPAFCPAKLPNNIHGLQGAGANFVRYGFESIHLTPAGDLAGKMLTGKRPSHGLQQIYDRVAAPWTGNQGTHTPFAIHWDLTAAHAGFGPFGFLLILPAMGYCLVRGSRRLKSVAIAFTGYLLLVCLVAAWQPGNASFTGYIYICGGFTVAHFLPPWRLKRTSRKTICGLCLALMIYAAAGNTAKPLADFAAATSGFRAILSGQVSRGALEMKAALKRGVWCRPAAVRQKDGAPSPDRAY